MKTVSMSGSLRANVGKKDAKSLRLNGQVPCVLYGGEQQIHFFTDATNFRDIIYTPEVCYIELDLEGKKYKAIAQDVQYHKVSDSIIHVDFFELTGKQSITLAIPMKFVGSSPGVLKGGKLVKNLRKINVLALPNDMPECIEINISKMEIGDFFKVNQLTTNKYSFVESPATTIAMVKTTRNVQEDAAEVKK